MKTIGEIFTETKADYIIIAFDETRFWIDAVKKRINKAFGVYLCKNEPTNCCSFEVNYPCTFLYNSFERKPEFENDEYLNEVELENDNNGYNYHLESDKPDKYYVNVITNKFDTEDDIEEYYKGNQVL
jgi:hypothetical protein